MPKLPEQRFDQPFQRIPLACATTGLSQHFLREGCKDGSVPHVKSGSVYLVNIPALLRKLDAITEAGS
jgi:hypothetical protein